jgi:GAF domain-containing protein
MPLDFDFDTLDFHLELPAGIQIMIGFHGIKTMIAAPLLRENKAIGGIVVGRFDYRPFTDTQIDLLKILADQAVIAIEPRFRENARNVNFSRADLFSALRDCRVGGFNSCRLPPCKSHFPLSLSA